MGLTCANLHVFTGGLPAPLQEADIDHFLEEAYRPLGFERAKSASAAERALAVIPAPSWLTVLDPASVVSEDWAEFAQQLSQTSGCPALIASVYDSDKFAFLLFEKGKQVDGYATDKELVPLKFKKWAAKKRTAEWGRAFARQLDEKEVRKLTRPTGPFADAMLHRLCKLVSLAPEHAALNSSDLVHSPGQALRMCHFRRSSGAATAPRYAAQPVKHISLLLGETHRMLLGFSPITVAAHLRPDFAFSGTAVDQGL